MYRDSSNMGLLLGFRCLCPECNAMAVEPVTCSQCGRYGHAGCLRLEYFQSFPFCGACMCNIIIEYGQRENQKKREEWKTYYRQQLMTWKERVTTALGLSSAVGAMIGGATAVLAGSAVGLARGAVTAAAAATTHERGRSRDPARLALPSSAASDSQMKEHSKTTMRSLSEGGTLELSLIHI